MIGMAVQVMFDAADWPAERQHRLLDSELRKLYRAGTLPASITAWASAAAE